MSTPKTTKWSLEPRTGAKHAILDAYLKAWFPILGKDHTEIVYVDGFCGPGRYEGGELGSPLVALQAAISNQIFVRGRATFWFIDAEPSRIDLLESELSELAVPENFHVKVVCGNFADVFDIELTRLESTSIPAFVFIDPFGFKEIPFEFVSRILALPRTEVLINVMIEFMNRFLETPDEKVQRHIVNAFGTDACMEIARSPGARIESLRTLYLSQLKQVAKYVRFFEMLNVRSTPVYDLFFATNHPLGHVKMKEAMWKVDKEHGFRFSDADDPNQPVLFGNEEAWKLVLEKEIERMFRGFERVPVERIEAFVNENTAYLTRHMKAVLKDMESGKRIRVEEIKQDGSKRRSGTYPDGTLISFTTIQEALF